MKPYIWLVVALLATNAAWTYVTIDRAVTLDHQTDEVVRQKQISGTLASLLVDLSREADINAVETMLQHKHPDLLMKRQGDTLEVGDVALQFRQGRLEKVVPF